MRYSFNLNDNTQEIANEKLIEIFERSMNEIRNLAVINAPVDTSHLRSSIQLEIIDDTHILITSFASYSSYVEFGTWKMKPQPYLRPAIDEVRFKRIKQIAQQVLL